jgi:PIN domain nuclease of toxin-antitoxin system
VGRWSRQILGSGTVGLAPLSASVAVAAAQLPEFHADPADRFIYATAREMRIPLISKDATKRTYALEHGDVRVIR